MRPFLPLTLLAVVEGQRQPLALVGGVDPNQHLGSLSCWDYDTISVAQYPVDFMNIVTESMVLPQ